jgi:hypothetical protein
LTGALCAEFHLFLRGFRRDAQVALYVCRRCPENAQPMGVAPRTPIRRNVMKLNKTQAIARRNQQLGGAVLGTNNCHFAELNRNRNIWWFDLPVSRLAIGQYEWIHLLLHTPATDELLHLKVPTVFLREKLEGLVIRNEGKRKAALSLELSADKDSYLQDMRPAGTNVNFAPFRQ